MSKLYELTAAFDTVLSKLYDEDFDEQAVLDTLESIEAEIEDKADGYAIILREIEADENKVDAEIKRLQARKKTLANRKEWLKGNLFNTMKQTGKTKFKTALFSFSINKVGGLRKLILDCEVDKLPTELRKVKTTVEADNAAIRELMKASGKDKCAYAHLEPQGENLSIS